MPCTGHPQTHQTSPTTQQVVHWCWCGHNQTMLARFVWHGNVVGVFDPSNKTCCGAMLWCLHPVHHHHIACTPTHMPPCCHACLTPLQDHLAIVVHHSVWPLASTPHLVVDVVALQPHLPPSHHEDFCDLNVAPCRRCSRAFFRRIRFGPRGRRCCAPLRC